MECDNKNNNKLNVIVWELRQCLEAFGCL